MGYLNNTPLRELYEVVKSRKETFTEESYTCYLFEKGLDKILKKCGEECSEMIIAAKSHESAFNNNKKVDAENSKDELENEICDLLYHMTVLMVEQGVKLEDIENMLRERSQKIGNLKTFHETDHSS